MSSRRLASIIGTTAVGAVLALAGCSSSSGPAPASSSSSGDDHTTSTTSTTSSAPQTTSSGSGGWSPSLVPASGRVTDDVFGNSIAVEGFDVIPGSAFPADVVAQASILKGGSVVVIKVALSPATTKEYSVTAWPDTIQIKDSTGGLTTGATAAIRDAVQNLGYGPVLDLSANQTGEGYIVASANRIAATPMTVTLHRLAFSTSGGGAIPTQDWLVATLG